MSARHWFGVGLGLFLSVAVAVGTASAGVRVKLEDVPKAAVKAIQDRFPKATIRYVDKERDGKYEFALKQGDRTFDVGVTGEGKVFKVKEEIAEDKVPRAVKEGLQKAYKGARIVETEKVIVIDGKKEAVTYEMKIKTDDKTREVTFDESGKEVD